MNCFELNQAQQLFPELVERAKRGEDVIITERNQPVVKFVAVEQGMKASNSSMKASNSSMKASNSSMKASNSSMTAPADSTKRRRRPGSAKGLVHISDDFDEPLEDFREYM